MEELFLETFLSFDDLNVIKKEDVNLAIPLLEFRHGVLADGVDVLIEELFGRDIPNLVSGVDLAHIVGNGLKKVGLAQAGVAIDEERVVRLCRSFGNTERRGMGKSIRCAGDEGIERIARVDGKPKLGRLSHCCPQIGGSCQQLLPIVGDIWGFTCGWCWGEVCRWGCDVGFDVDEKRNIALSNVCESARYKGEIARLESFFDDRTGHGNRKHGSVEVEWSHHRERGHPHRLGDLLAQSDRALRPQLFGLVHLHDGP